MAYTFAQLTQYAVEAGFPANVAPTMAAIALAESSGNASATHRNSNGSTDFGLWQINSVHGSLLAGKNWADPLTNAKMAFSVYQSQGERAWSTFSSGAYKRYLNGAPAAGNVTGSGNLADGSVGANANAQGSDPLSGVVDSITNSIGAPFQSIAKTLSIVDKLSLPETWVRIGAGVFGLSAVIFGIVFLAKEVRT